MFAISIEKMVKNKGLFLCMLMACVFSVSLLASIPAFENAVKVRVLRMALLDRQYETGLPPLVHRITYSDSQIAEYGDGSIETFNTWYDSEFIPRFGMPVAASQVTFTHHSSVYLHVSPDNQSAPLFGARTRQNAQVPATVRGGIMHTTGLFDHVELVAGRFPNEPDASGTIEVVVSEIAAVQMPFMLGSEYLQRYTVPFDGSSEDVRFRVVGVIRMSDPADPFWVTPLSKKNPYATYETFMNTFHTEGTSRFSALWTTTFDHTAIIPENLQTILDAASEENTGTLINVDILQSAIEREIELGTFLLVLLVPNLALLVFFIIMMSGLILDHDKVEISLLRSRGAGKGHVLTMYTIQTLLIAGLAIAMGIPLSVLLCSAMGASSGFLEFVGRAPLEVTVTENVFWYAFAGAGLYVVSTLLPVLFSKNDSIVIQRRIKAKRGTKLFFEKYYLDLVLIGVSLYGYIAYRNLSELLTVTDAEVSEYAADPLIFLLSTFFLVGCAMLFTRLYPYIIRILFRVGQSVWPPAIYASLSAARSRPRSRYIMLFIIMAVAISLYAAAAARTINSNYLDRAMYDIGADLVIKERWPFIDRSPVYTDGGTTYVPPHVKDAFFNEPPFEIYSEPDGVALATKVYRNSRTRVMKLGGKSVDNMNVIAIYPDEFARVSWWRDDMFSYHFNEMMNAMSLNPHVVLLSRGLMEHLGVSHGDEVIVMWENNTNNLNCYVFDAVDLFPTFNPVAPDGAPTHLIVMNYELVKSEYRLEPYEVWIMVEDTASSTDIMQYILDNRELPTLFFDNDPKTHKIDPRIPQFSINDSQKALAAILNDPQIVSMNGFLTLSFVMTLAVMAVGFLVFWSFDLRSRRLQISIMRSAGMSQGGVTAMLLWEQALLSLLPLAVGFLLGEIGSGLFVPMFEMGGSESPLPFRIFRLAEDSMRVGIIVSVIILLAIAMLWLMAARIKISQTLKLGEE